MIEQNMIEQKYDRAKYDRAKTLGARDLLISRKNTEKHMNTLN